MAITNLEEDVPELRLPHLEGLGRVLGYDVVDTIFHGDETIDCFVAESRAELLARAQETVAGGFWLELKETEEVKHVIDEHLNPVWIFKFGVPIFDIELFIAMGFSLDPICEHIYKTLAEHQNHAFYREHLVKILLFIDRKKTGQVDWSRVAEVYEGYKSVAFNPEQDTLDVSFDAALRDLRVARAVL